ncbi:MAG: restriction endonuclease, SacI family [Rhizobiaceae bacterium]
MKISNAEAIRLLREAAADADGADPAWTTKIERLSQLCADGLSKTHIAFLGTAMLAKAVDRRADLFAIKPNHALDNPNAFSARVLSEKVLVPLAAELGINIGVTGRQPLNNQPYFRMTRLDDGTPVHPGGRAAFDYMLELVKELQELPDENAARAALRAFVAVRSRYQPRYADHDGGTTITPAQLTAAIRHFVSEDSEGGRRAQAVVAGLLDVFAGRARVESGRINDPSRKYPGDVCVRSVDDPDVWEKAIEVRDKPVAFSDVQIFGKKCVDMAVREAALVMVADQQTQLDEDALARWADGFGLGLTLFHGWAIFVDQVLFWSALPKPVAATKALAYIHERLVLVEARPNAIDRWRTLVAGP